jgi:hypothetical protein
VKRTHETASVEGYTTDAKGEPVVMVRVRRGKGIETHTFPEKYVRRKPHPGKPGKERAPRVLAKAAKKSCGNLTTARVLLAEAKAALEKLDKRAHEIYPQAGEEPTREYTNARRRMVRLEEEINAYGSIIADLEGEKKQDAPEPWDVDPLAERMEAEAHENPMSWRSRFIAAINRELKAIGQKRMTRDEQRYALSVTGSGDSAQAADLAYRIAQARRGHTSNPPKTIREGVAILLTAAGYDALASQVRSGEETPERALSYAAHVERHGRPGVRAKLLAGLELIRGLPERLRNPVRKGPLDWQGKAELARGMSARALWGALLDIAKTLPSADALDRETGSDAGGYYRDEASVYRAELARRLDNPARARGARGRIGGTRATASRAPIHNPTPPATRRALERGAKTFKRWHGFDPHSIVRTRKNTRGVPPVLVKLGDVPEIVYSSDKWTGKQETYIHKTGQPRPMLCTAPDGKGPLFIIGGRVKVTARGLVG